VSSGLPCDKFCFEGFLPQKKGRQSRLQELAREPRTTIIYESPRRVVKTLEQLCEHFGAERHISVCREISKIHEESVRGTVSEVLEHFKANEPKGEFVIIIAGTADSNTVADTSAGASPSDEATDKYSETPPAPRTESKYQRKLRERADRGE
jgi:16S rRNA C1402 (ribose-2'-O) methylase RsmI